VAPKATTLISRFRNFLRRPVHSKLYLLSLVLARLKAKFYYRNVFGAFGKGSVLFKPTLILSPEYMFVGRNVFIRPGLRMGASVADPEYPPEIRIGDNVAIEQDVEIGATGRILIRDYVAIGARCAIIGGFHPFLDVHSKVPVKDRLGGARSLTEIGEGSVLGVGTVVKMNVRIGRHVMTGPNAVVASNLPDYCLAEGNPAVVVLKYDPATDRWARPAKSP